MDAFFLERGDLAAVAPIDDVDLRVAVHVAHEPHAARAQNAPLPVEHQRGTEVHVAAHAFAVEHTTREIGTALGGTEVVREILQRTLAALVADRTVERVIHEKKLEDTRARLHDLGRLRRHDHAVCADRRARRLQLRNLLDLHDADAAAAVDADAGVIAVIRNGNAVLDRRLEHGLALLHGDLTAIYRQLDGVHSHQNTLWPPANR